VRGDPDRLFAAGARLVVVTAYAEARRTREPNEVSLFAVSPDGQLGIAADGRPPIVGAADTVSRLPRAGQL